MKRHLIAAVTAAALALTTIAATPAAAKNDNDAAKFILGAIALGLIVDQLSRDRDRPRHTPVRPAPHVPPVVHPRPQARFVPAECVYKVPYKQGWRDVVSHRCMHDKGLARYLPTACAQNLKVYGAVRKAYGAVCLSDYGYRIERARY